MIKTVLSFSVGSALRNGEFIALLFKFRFTDQSEQLTAWPQPSIANLFLVLTEYHQYLQQAGIKEDGDSIEKIIRNQAPHISNDEIANLPASAVVNNFKGNLREDHNLELTLLLGNKEKSEINILITPHQREWVMGYMANTMAEFNEDGHIFLPEGLPN